MKSLILSAFLFLVNQNFALPLSNEGNTYLNIPSFNSMDDALQAFNSSITGGDQLLYKAATEFLKNNFTVALRNNLTATLSEFAIVDLTGKHWFVEEIEVFYSAQRWLKAHPNVDKSVVVRLLLNVGLIAMNPDQLQDIVLPSELYETKDVTQALTIKAWNLDSNYERFPNQLAKSNILLKSLGATVQTECSEGIFDSTTSVSCSVTTTNYGGEGLVVKPSFAATLNNIEIYTTQYANVAVEVFRDSRWETVGNTTNVYGSYVFKFLPQRAESIRFLLSKESYREVGVGYVKASYKTC